MTYKINKTDGSLLTEIPDSTFDTNSTSVTLIGRNTVNFGEILNENFVKMLENFSSITSPSGPLIGQLWYDLEKAKLKVFDGAGFVLIGGPVVGAARPRPEQVASGDIWIDSVNNQFWMFDGIEWTLIGPRTNNTVAMTLDITGLGNNLGSSETVNTRIADILTDIARYYNPLTSPTGTVLEGTLCRLHTVSMSISSGQLVATRVNKTFIMLNTGRWQWLGDDKTYSYAGSPVEVN